MGLTRMVAEGRDISRLPNGIYDVLAHLEPGLMLDVGAAAGDITKLMLSKSPKSWVVAFEPFVGNLPFFEKALGNDDRVTLHKKAVGNESGTASFVLAPTVKGTEPGWETRAGYSSGGALKQGDIPQGRSTTEVELVTIDSLIDTPVRFFKIDVQGGELGVLEGASSLFDRDQIDIVFCEYSGQDGVLEFLLERNMDVYDTTYLIVPRQEEDPLDDWEVIGKKALSNGRIASLAWPSNRPTDVKAYAEFIRTQRPKRIVAQTDLIAVRPGFRAEYAQAVDKAKKRL